MPEAPAADSIEAEFARRLAGNDKKTRDKALKKLKQFLNLRSAKTDGGFTRVEMLSIWKGMFYCMWMSDKPLIQEDLANKISELLPGLSNTKTAMLLFDTFLETMQREWKGIDRLRMDKFYLLIRCVLRKTFEFLKQQNWNVGVVDWMLAILKNGPICPTKPVSGMQYHFCDIYLEELSKICKDELDSEVMLKFLDPYCLIVTNSKNYDIVKAASANIFQELIENSKPALDLLAEEEGLINVNGHTQTESYDSSPITALNVDYTGLADRLFELASQDGVLARNRKKVFRMVEKFRELAEGRLPLSDIPDAEYSSEDEVKVLEEHLTSELVSESGKEMDMKRDYQKIKKRKRKELAIEDNMDSDNEDDLVDPMNMDLDDENEEIGESTSESNQDLENPNEEADANNNQTSKMVNLAKKSSKKKKKKSKQESVIIGSNLQENESSSTSEQDVNSTVTELIPKKQKKMKKTNISPELDKNEELEHSENIPDILQDIEECKKAAEKKRKNKEKLKAKESLKKWLDSGTEGQNDQQEVVEQDSTAKKKNKNSKKVKNNDANVQNSNVQENDAAEAKNHITPSTKKNKKKRKSDLLNKESVSITAPDITTNIDETAQISTTETKKRKKKQKNDSPPTVESSINITDENTPKKTKSSKGVAKQEKLVEISSTSSVPTMSTFFKVAASKVDKAKKNKHLAAVKRKKDEPMAAHSPKRVVFEMSKTQIQPFRKFDKSIAVSASPDNVAFDPRKTPDFGLLKKGKSRKRQTASDFF